PGPDGPGALLRACRDARYPEGQGLPGRAWALRDLCTDEDADEGAMAHGVLAGRRGPRPSCCVPVLVQGEVEGALLLFIDEPEGEAAGPERLDTLRAAGRMLSLCAEHRRDLERQAQAAEDTATVRSVVDEVGRGDTAEAAARLGMEAVLS